MSLAALGLLEEPNGIPRAANQKRSTEISVLAVLLSSQLTDCMTHCSPRVAAEMPARDNDKKSVRTGNKP